MPKMTEDTLRLELDKMTQDATGNNSHFIRENEDLLDRYLGNPYGDEESQRSKVISNDCMDVVESDMPSLARIFLGAGDIMIFKPQTANEDDQDEADTKTKYVNWQIRNQPWSFSVLHGFIKNAEIQKISIVKYFIDEKTEIEEHKKTGLSNDELAMVEQSLEGKDVESIEIDREEENEKEENSVIFKVKRTNKPVVIKGVELENFRMTRNAESKETAELVGDVSLMSRGDLLAAGFQKSDISQIPLSGDIRQNSRLQDIRDHDEGGVDHTQAQADWASEEVEIEDLYALIDFDGDGITERRHIMRSANGEVVLVNEVFNHVPYAINTAILMPHKVVGRSRVEITSPVARVKTAILRGVNDNIYAVNNPRIAANTNVNMDDLLIMRPNGVVRTLGESNPGQNMFAVEVPYIGDKALQVVQYWDQARAQSTGSLLASQGLNADDLGKETATRFKGIEDASGAKLELVARVMAETGFRQLFEGVAWLDAQFQNAEIEIQILGEELKVNPADWQYNQSVVSHVGLGAGDASKELETMTALWQLSKSLETTNSPLTDQVKQFNILKNMVTASGQPDVSEFFNNPDRPTELVQAENEALTATLQQMQMQLQQLQTTNPLAEAENIRAQAKLIEAQGKAQLDVVKMQEEQRQFNATLLQNQSQATKEMAARLTELELKYAADVPGALV